MPIYQKHCFKPTIKKFLPENFLKRVWKFGFIRGVISGSSFVGYYPQVDSNRGSEYLKVCDGNLPSELYLNTTEIKYTKPDENTSVSLQVIFEVAKKLWNKN